MISPDLPCLVPAAAMACPSMLQQQLQASSLWLVLQVASVCTELASLARPTLVCRRQDCDSLRLHTRGALALGHCMPTCSTHRPSMLATD
jgi:hypothetical protein